MTTDDILAYLARKPKRERPHELRSDAKMLQAWLLLRDNMWFRQDMLSRHGLRDKRIEDLDESKEFHAHAIGNAWGFAVEAIMEAAK